MDTYWGLYNPVLTLDTLGVSTANQNWMRLSIAGTQKGYIRWDGSANVFIAGGTGGSVVIGDSSSPKNNLIVYGTSSTCTIGNGGSATMCSSDARLKNIDGVATGNLAKIMQLQPTYYKWKNDASGTQRLGLIAQNVQTVLPELVMTGSDGYLQLDYAGIVSPLIGAVQEQQGMISDTQNRLATLENTIQASSGSDLTNGGAIDGNLAVGGNLSVSGNVSAANISISGNLVVGGEVTVATKLTTRDIVVGGHIITAGVTPTATVGVAAGVAGGGTGGVAAPVATVEGNDTSGTVTVTVGESTAADELAKLTFNVPFAGGSKPRVVLTAANRDAAHLGVYYDASTSSSTSFSIMVDQAPQAGKTYQFTYFVVQ